MELDPRIAADLARSGLVPKDINARVEASNGFTEARGYVIPYYLPNGTPHPTMHRVRLFTPREDGSRYDQPPGVTYPYFHPRVDWEAVRRSPHKIIVEGEKKAAAAIKHLKLTAIGIGGCYNWQGPQSKTLARPLCAEIADLLKPGDTVEVIFDGDYQTNRMVENALAELCIALRYLRCTPLVVMLQQEPNTPKLGLDDWLVAEPRTLGHYKALPRSNGAELREGRTSLYYRTELDCNARGEPHNSAANIRNALLNTEYYKGKLWYDDFRRLAVTNIGGPERQVTDADLSLLLIDVQQRLWPRATASAMVDVLNSLQTMPGYHKNPLRDYLDGLAWDHNLRIEALFPQVFGSEDSEYIRSIARNWFIGAVARVYTPGCKQDHMLILEGRQGIGKTTALEVLGGQWYHATGTAMDSKDFLAEMEGRWVIDVVELDSFRRTEFTAIIGLLTKREDRFRRAYGRTVDTCPRSSVIVGSTNETQYLPGDSNGTRRFWPVRCGLYIDTQLLKEIRDQLWAEAVFMYRAGDTWHSTPQEETNIVQAARAALHPWTQPIENYVMDINKLQVVVFRGVTYSAVTTAEILTHLRVDTAHQTMVMGRIVTSVMRQMGFEDVMLRNASLLNPPAGMDPDGKFRAFVKFLSHKNEVPKRSNVSTLVSARSKY